MVSPKSVDRVTEIERLAALEPIQYEAVRIAAAKQLNVRANILDREVARTRRALGLDRPDVCWTGQNGNDLGHTALARPR
jgi:hypothetical protein